MRWFVTLLVILAILAAVITGFYALSEPVIPMKEIGVLLSGDIRYHKLDGLIDGLANQGLVEGIHYNLIIKNAEGSIDKMRQYGLELAGTNADVLVAFGGVEADALKIGIQQINYNKPLVLAGVASSMERGLIEEFQQHKSNITGVDNYHAELAGKRLELLTKILPDIQNVLIVSDPNVVPGKHSMEFVEEAAKMLGITISKYQVNLQANIDKDLGKIVTNERVDAITYLPSFLLEEKFDQLIQAATKYKIPVMGVNEYEVEQGALASYGVSYYHQGAQAAPIVTKILSGQNANQIPVESPDRIELAINLRTAKKLDVEISPLGLRFASTIVR